MSLLPGTQLGPYELIELLGAGGMGEVYRAADPRLGRQVAVKVLPAEFAADQERLARFEQEARAAAALSHPNIAVVYDVGADGGTHYIVQELLAGASLRSLLIDRPNRPSSEWLPIAADIASALAAAHGAGIVHRDVKPENVMVSADGRAKVLDFGLAKLTEAKGAGQSDANSPTMLGTMAGTVMGTVGYLAPEQAAGQPVDRRADIFALGCILYEMAAGERPFGGRSAAETIAHVLHDEPRALPETRPDLPREYQRVVKKCLAKDPARRYQHADDLVVDLRELQTQPAAAASSATNIGQAAAAARTGPARWLWPVVVAALAGVAAWGWFRPVPEASLALPSRLSILVPNQGGMAAGIQRQIAITPDGSTLIFPGITDDGAPRIMRMTLDDTEASVLPGVDPFLGDYAMSPDGREFIGTVIQSRQMFRQSIMGGNVRPLPREIQATPNVAWASDGTIWFGVGAGLMRLAPDDTVSLPFDDERGSLVPMQVLPGDRALLAVRVPSGANSGPATLLDLESGTPTMLIDRDVVEIRYTPGYLVYVQADGSLQATPFDVRQGRVTGEPVRIATDVAMTGVIGAQFAVAQNGTVAYIPEESRSLVLVDRDGGIRPATRETRNFHAPMFSPDGGRIATDFNSAEGRDVWVLSMADGLLSRATFDRDGHDATWTPDGGSLTYTSVRDGLLNLLRTRPGVAQATEVLLASAQLAYGGVWLDDGQSLITVANALGSNSGTDLAWIRNAGSGPLEPLVVTRFEEHFPAVSPDNRWLAFVSNQTGQDEVYVRPLGQDGDQVQVSLSGGTEPAWNPRGGELFYRTGPGLGSEMAAAEVRTDPTFAVTSRRMLFPMADMVSAVPHRNYDISPDGKTFVMVRFNPSTRIIVIQNLPALVRKLGGGTRQAP